MFTEMRPRMKILKERKTFDEVVLEAVDYTPPKISSRAKSLERLAEASVRFNAIAGGLAKVAAKHLDFQIQVPSIESKGIEWGVGSFDDSCRKVQDSVFTAVGKLNRQLIVPQL